MYNFKHTDTPLCNKDLISLNSNVTVPTNSSLECSKFASKAEVYKKERDYVKALQAFNLRLALNHSGPSEDISTLRMLNDVANVHLLKGDVNEAIRCASAAVRDAPQYTALAGTLHMTLMKCYMHALHEGGPNEEKARIHFQQGRDAVEMHVGAHHPLVNEFYAALGELYLSTGKYEAFEYLHVACDRSSSVLGKVCFVMYNVICTLL